MNARTKSILLLMAALIVGGLLGALVQARLAEQRIEQIAAHRSEGGFMRFVERGIEPVDAEQEQAVREILRGASMHIASRTMQHRREVRSIVDSTRTELSRVLSPEQMQQLDAHLERERPMRRGRGPGAMDGERRQRQGPPGERRAPRDTLGPERSP
jgi:hypothetical protein